MSDIPTRPRPAPAGPRKGQRFASELEPELGLGTIEACDARTVTVWFPASDTTRRYAAGQAPLVRVRFRIGDRLTGRSGRELVVAGVEEKDGILVYRGEGGSLAEGELSDRLSSSTPLDRLLDGRADPSARFDLRHRLLAARQRALGSPARGFAGGRIGLIPHQLYIAREVTRRHAPRVLLADEVGLGKTIEACLILHHLLISGRIGRALVLVPESLLHQWLVELRRRFNLRFSLFDEERCRSIEAGSPGQNPFLDDQLVLASTAFLVRQAGRAAQAADAGWDLLVVDEAHHLGWDARGPSPEYAMVERIAASARGLLLITATPEQLGLTGHFARLRLLDPARYSDLDRFVAETAGFRQVAALADALQAGRRLGRADEALLRELLGDDAALPPSADRGPDRRQALLAALIDRHGTGRILFRNTRAAMGPPRAGREDCGFPGRMVELARLEPSSGAGADPGDDLANDPRVAWLIETMAALGEEKALLLCHERATVLALEAALRARARLKIAVFHEGLTLVQRDRNAAFFAAPEGARLLLCSEIGSEGRNFQFARHLILFDLPLDPDLLEQRIGRLDRIGQKGQVHVHVPWVEGSREEVLVAWHDQALGDLQRSLRGGQRMVDLFGRRVRALAAAFRGTSRPAGSGPARAQRAELRTLVEEARAASLALERELEEGRDHLLELSSFRPAEAQALIDEIRAIEDDATFPDLALRLFEELGIYAEEVAPRTYRLNSERLASSDFPELERGDAVVTFDRDRALAREDLHFLTIDHPLFQRALDRFLGDAAGTAAFASAGEAPTSIPAGSGPGSTPASAGPGAPLAVEAIHLLEAIAPRRLHVDRFLAATPIRVVVDAAGADLAARDPGRLADLPAGLLAATPERYRLRIERLVEEAARLAEERARALRAQAISRARALLGAEAERLRALRRVNPAVRAEEITLTEEELGRVVEAIEGSRLRLDALRVIAGPAAPGR